MGKKTLLLQAEAEGALEQAIQALRAGEIVVFPTDTVYGVGCDLWNPEAIERLYWAKKRPKKLPIPVLVSAPEHVQQVAHHLPPYFDVLVESFWPGGLTLIVRRRPQVPAVLCAGGDTVAVRMPAHPLALRLIEAMGGALAATSANISGNPAPKSASDALEELQGRVAIVLDGGDCPGGIASTIVDLVSSPPRLLRHGPLSATAIRELLPDLIE